MVKQWVDKLKPSNVLDLGCGIGLFGYVFDYLGIDYKGYELSDHAVKISKIKNIKQGDVTKDLKEKDNDLVLVLDVLEHIEEEDLERTLNYIKEYGNIYIFSIPYIGDPNLDNDSTHRIFREKTWWKEKLSKYLQIEEVPAEWAFSHQLLIGRKK